MYSAFHFGLFFVRGEDWLLCGEKHFDVVPF